MKGDKKWKSIDILFSNFLRNLLREKLSRNFNRKDLWEHWGKNGYNFDYEDNDKKKFSGATKILVLHVLGWDRKIVSKYCKGFHFAQPLEHQSRNLYIYFSRIDGAKRASGLNRVSLDAVFSSCAKIQLGMQRHAAVGLWPRYSVKIQSLSNVFSYLRKLACWKSKKENGFNHKIHKETKVIFFLRWCTFWGNYGWG